MFTKFFTEVLAGWMMLLFGGWTPPVDDRFPCTPIL
jgi:hypothetical protein